jgi:hypothetical protein
VSAQNGLAREGIHTHTVAREQTEGDSDLYLRRLDERAHTLHHQPEPAHSGTIQPHGYVDRVMQHRKANAAGLGCFRSVVLVPLLTSISCKTERLVTKP